MQNSSILACSHMFVNGQLPVFADLLSVSGEMPKEGSGSAQAARGNFESLITGFGPGCLCLWVATGLP